MIKETVELVVVNDVYTYTGSSISFANIGKSEAGRATVLTLPKKAVEMIVDAFLAKNPTHGLKEEHIVGEEKKTTSTRKGK